MSFTQSLHSILDNPIWNALISGSKSHALGNDRVKFMQRDKGLFVGFQSYHEEEWNDLETWFPKGNPIILFTPEQVTVTKIWHMKLQRPIWQMIYDSEEIPKSEEKPRAIPLAEKDVDEMLQLTALTNPGPFFSKTIELGYFEGIFENENLVAMTGQRLQPDPFVEISAVCTHPDHLGKGYAAELINNQIRKIVRKGKYPFLHVYPENFVAIRLYEKLGFRLRREMRVYFLEKTT